MKVLIIGGGGMLGHKVWQVMSGRFDTWVTVRSSYNSYARFNLFRRDRMVEGVDVANIERVTEAFALSNPDVVINCVGIIKQLPAVDDPIISLAVNSIFPHRLARLCKAAHAALIHISTDCVFSGRRGNYKESDTPDAEDSYGRTKLLGELGESEGLTLRTSLIGREIMSKNGLVEWFLSQEGRVRGYTKAIFSGVTTETLAKILADIIVDHRDLTGLYHLASSPINKYEVLCLLRDMFHHQVAIEPFQGIEIDHSLDGGLLRHRTGIKPPAWNGMVQELANDLTPYAKWRSQ
jgi:dTDP-4-dehydrorhamnose reductase